MEPRFRSVLKKYSDLAKSERDKRGREGYNDVREEIKGIIEEVAEEYCMKTLSAHQIYVLQREKQRVMNWLKIQFSKINRQETEYMPGARHVRMENGHFVAENPDGTTEIISLGSILTDGIWGIDYDLDPQTVPKILRKRYLIEKARLFLQRYLDYQLGILKEKSEQTEENYKHAYSGLIKNRQRLNTEGHLAERMVYAYIRKLTFDYNLPFKIDFGNIFEDIRLKMDFVIRIQKRKRGVMVEGAEDAQTYGIQFTISTNSLQEKAEQVAKALEDARRLGLNIDDIILVQVPLKDVKHLFAVWSVDKPSGGPDKLWDNKVKKEIFQNLLKDLFSPEQIGAMWEKISQPKNPFE